MNHRISNFDLTFDLADIADGVTLKLWSPQVVKSKFKADGNHVTTADGDAEIAIRQALGTARPDDGFLGEEIGSRPSRNEHQWILDGIDGTSGFVARLPNWGTLIALEQEGELTLGMISRPAQDKWWWAQSGFGAFTGTCNSNRNGRQIRVSTNTHECKSRCYFAPVQKPSPTSPTVY